MKKIALTIAAILLCVSPSLGQHYIAPTVINSLGQPVPTPVVRVCTEPAVGSPCTPLATIYTCVAQDGSCPAANPLTGDANGNFDFYASTSSIYHFEISGPSLQPFIQSYVYMPGAGGGGVGGLISINGDTTPPQILIGAGGITVTDNGGGSHTITGPSGTVSGNGTPPFLPIWLTATSLGNSTEQDLNNTFQSGATQGFSSVYGVFDSGGVGPQVLDFGSANDPSGGTQRFYLAKVVNNVAYRATTGDTTATLYAVADTLLSNGTAKCAYGTTGQACLQAMQGGRAILTADAGGVAAGHYFGESTATGSAIMDLGATPLPNGCLGVAEFGAIVGGAAGAVRMGSCGAVGSTGANISAENMIPVMTSNAPYPTRTTDIVYTLMPWGPDTAFMGPLPPTNPQSAWVQDKVCSLGSVAALPCQFDNPVVPGDSIYAVGVIQCGLGCVGQTFSMSDNFSDPYTQIATATGANFPFSSNYSSGVHGGITTVTFTPNSPGPDYTTQVQIIELRGAVAVDTNSLNPTVVPFPVFNPVTTLLSPDTIVATLTTRGGCSQTYSAGTGYALLQTGCNGSIASMASEITNVLTTGTYTPTMATAGGAFFALAIATAFQITLPAFDAKPFPRWIRYVDLTASGDFPSLTGNAGECFSTDGNVVTLIACATGAITSVTGTANQIDVTSGTTPVVSLDSSLIFPGTITMGANAADFSSATSFKPPGTGGTLTVGTADINWATLGTGIVKNTTTTGAKTLAAYTDIVPLWASGSCSGYLKSDGTCSVPAATTKTIPFQAGTPGGSALSTGPLAYLTIPFGCTITGWSIAVDAGTATIKFLKVAAGTAIPTLGSNSINTSGVAIASGTVIQSTTLTDFTTTTITANDIMAADMITTSSVGFIDAQVNCQ